MRSGGVALCCNTLSQLPIHRQGLPVAFAVRGVLECDDRAAAHAYLASVPHASGQNYLIGDSVGIADYECSAAGIRNSL